MTRHETFLALQAQDTEDCVLWGHGQNGIGYGTVRHNGKKQYVHRLSCEMAHGAPEPGQTEAAHSCRNRHCFNPRHLRWATPAENNADKLRDGTLNRGERNGSAKLTPYQVREMRIYARSGVKQRELAKYYGVAQTSVSDVVTGRKWGWLV